MPYKTKEAQAASAAKYYKKNKVKMIQRAKAFTAQARQRNRDYINGYKAAKGCARCPMRDIRCLDFHHVGEKTANVADSIPRAWGLEKLQAEIEKCIVLCANCHRIHTAG